MLFYPGRQKFGNIGTPVGYASKEGCSVYLWCISMFFQGPYSSDFVWAMDSPFRRRLSLPARFHCCRLVLFINFSLFRLAQPFSVSLLLPQFMTLLHDVIVAHAQFQSRRHPFINTSPTVCLEHRPFALSSLYLYGIASPTPTFYAFRAARHLLSLLLLRYGHH